MDEDVLEGVITIGFLETNLISSTRRVTNGLFVTVLPAAKFAPIPRILHTPRPPHLIHMRHTTQHPFHKSQLLRLPPTISLLSPAVLHLLTPVLHHARRLWPWSPQALPYLVPPPPPIWTQDQIPYSVNLCPTRRRNPLAYPTMMDNLLPPPFRVNAIMYDVSLILHTVFLNNSTKLPTLVRLSIAVRMAVWLDPTRGS